MGTPLTLSATATSGLAVSFSSETTSVCTVSWTVASFVASGTCMIEATKTGNTVYAAATPVTQSFTVNPATVSGPGTLTYSTNPAAYTVGTVITNNRPSHTAGPSRPTRLLPLCRRDSNSTLRQASSPVCPPRHLSNPLILCRESRAAGLRWST